MAEAVNVPSTSGDDAVDIAERILELCETSSVPITDNIMQAEMPTSTAHQRVAALNRLISQDKIEILKKGNELFYRTKAHCHAAKNIDGNNEEKLVYQIVAGSGDKGIWSRDIRAKSNMSLTYVNKILKTLENKRLIKSIKPVTDSKKKVYMLYEAEPDSSITGGSWYSDQDFESEFVDVLNEQCFRYLHHAAVIARAKKLDPLSQRNASCKSTKEVWKYIKDVGISKVPLSMGDIECILNTLIQDGKVEKLVINGQSGFYKVLNPVPHLASIMSFPCGICPVMRDCLGAGRISPLKCPYIPEFLKF